MHLFSSLQGKSSDKHEWVGPDSSHWGIWSKHRLCEQLYYQLDCLFHTLPLPLICSLSSLCPSHHLSLLILLPHSLSRTPVLQVIISPFSSRPQTRVVTREMHFGLWTTVMWILRCAVYPSHSQHTYADYCIAYTCIKILSLCISNSYWPLCLMSVYSIHCLDHSLDTICTVVTVYSNIVQRFYTCRFSICQPLLQATPKYFKEIIQWNVSSHGSKRTYLLDTIGHFHSPSLKN